MTKIIRQLKRSSYALTAALLFVVIGYSALVPGKAHAALLDTRSITLSDSGASTGAITGIGSGTAVTYRVSASLYNNADSMIIDFCSNSPIIGDTCTAPTGFTAASAAVTNGTGGTTTISAWTITPAAAQVKLAKGAGATATGNATTPVNHTFSLTGITNPSTVGSFYARIYTFTNGTFGTYASAASPGNIVDYGGIALSTNNIISITAKVQETLSFCVSGTNQAGTGGWSTNHDCSDPNAATAPALTLGNGTPKILTPNAVDYGTVFSQLSTNATHGATIAMRNSNNTCTGGGLSADAGATCAIPAAGATAVAITAGTAKFGMFVWNSQPDAASSVGSTTPAATYHDNAHQSFTVNGSASTNFNSVTTAADPIVPTDVFYGFDKSTAATTQFGNVQTTFGSVVATCPGPIYRVNQAYTFAATASLTTPAGIYTANLDLIATGTF